MARWKIYTKGPLIDFDGTIEEAMAYVEEGATLKRGWTHQWQSDGAGRFLCQRYNSKGRIQEGYTIFLAEVKPQIKAQ